MFGSRPRNHQDRDTEVQKKRLKIRALDEGTLVSVFLAFLLEFGLNARKGGMDLVIGISE